MSRIHILIVDDESSIRRVVGAGLKAKGFEVTEATDGEEAIRAVEKSSPDLMLLDILMPKTNGYEVCRRVREWSHVPIIMLTAMSDTMDKVKSLNIGADDHLVKPFGIQELIARVEAVLRRYKPIATDHYTLGRLSHQLTDIIATLKNNEIRSPSVAQNIAADYPPRGLTQSKSNTLSVRQVGVLRRVAEGMSNKEIAAELNVSAQTIKNHMTHILDRLYANDRSHAVVLAFRLGLLDLNSGPAWQATEESGTLDRHDLMMPLAQSIGRRD